jgi:hypothetical protein
MRWYATDVRHAQDVRPGRGQLRRFGDPVAIQLTVLQTMARPGRLDSRSGAGDRSLGVVSR